ncbi:hypothetical protein HJC23_003118 [Cyclotella cryptica]|uniref:Uncharacterized protein n=1 Tax=Cyclotella cryptica TaxID=29204 RepID=A0ABD3P5F4_9STRA
MRVMPVEKARKEEEAWSSNASLPLWSWETESQVQSQTARERCKRRGAIALDISANDPLSVSDTKTEGTVDTDTEKNASLTGATDVEATDCKIDIENVHTSTKQNQPTPQPPKSFVAKQGMHNYEIKDIEKAPHRVAHSNNTRGQLRQDRSNVIVSRDFDDSNRRERPAHGSSTRNRRQPRELAPFVPPHLRMKRQHENNAVSEQRGTGHARSGDSVATDNTNPQGANSKKSLQEVKPNKRLRDSTLHSKPTHAKNVKGREILSRSITSSKSRRSADTRRLRDSTRRAKSAPRSRNPSISRRGQPIQDTNHKRSPSETNVQNSGTVSTNDEDRGSLRRNITSPISTISTEINHHKDKTQRPKSAPRSRNSAIGHIGQIDPSGSFDIISIPSTSTAKGQDKYLGRRQTIGRCENVENQHQLATDCDASQRRHQGRDQLRSRHRSLDDGTSPYSQQISPMRSHDVGHLSSPQRERYENEQAPSVRSNVEGNLTRHFMKAQGAAEDASTISGLSRVGTRQYHPVPASDDVSTRYSDKSYNTRKFDDRSPHQHQTAADEMSFSTKSFSTRHTSRSYPGRRRHTNESGKHGQFPPKQAMYRSKSASRSVLISTGFADEQSQNPLENLDFIDCYSIPIVDDDPSLITDTASYDFRSRRKNRPHAPSVYLSFDATSVQSKTGYDDDLTDAMSRRSNRTYGTSAQSSVKPNMLYDDDFTEAMSRRSTRTYGTSAQSVKSTAVYDDDLTEVMSRRSTRTSGTSAHSYGKSKSVYDDDSTDANGDFDELTEFDSVLNVPSRDDATKIHHPKKRWKRKQFFCALITAVLTLAAIGTIVVFVALPAINKRRIMSLQAPEIAGTEKDHEAAYMNNSMSPSTQPSFGELTAVSQLDPPPKDLEGRCSPSNFPHGSHVCKEFCRFAECCYPGVNKSCFDVSADTPTGSANLVQCEAYRPYCDIFYDPWVGSIDGIIRPPPNNLDKVCANRRRRHDDTDVAMDEVADSRSLVAVFGDLNFARDLNSGDFECLKACLPSKCCSGIKVTDHIPNDLTVSSYGTYTNVNGDFVITSCIEKNEASCLAYEKLCQGVFERHDAFDQNGGSSLSQSTEYSSIRATFSPTLATMPISSTPSPWFSQSDVTLGPFLNELIDPTQSTISPQKDTSPYSSPMGSQLYRPTANNYHPTSLSPTYLASSSSYPNNRPAAVTSSTTNDHHTSSPPPSWVPIIETTPSGGDSSSSAVEIPTTSSHSTSLTPSIPTLENKPFGGNSSFTYSSSLTPTQKQSSSISDNVPSLSESTASNAFPSKLTSIPSRVPSNLYDSHASADPEPGLGTTPSSSQTLPISKAPAAAIEQIKAACTGDKNIEKIKSGDKKECLNACSAGLCCYIDQFNAAGIISKDQNGFPMNLESCMKGNEVNCFDYAICLVMTLERETTQTHSPSPAMVVPRPVSIDIVPYANAGKIFQACSGPDNIKLITNQNIQASMNCLDACSDGLCCYIDMFSKRGITAFDEEGNTLVIDSCWEGNEEVCSGYEGCLVLTLAPSKPTPSSPALNSPLTSSSVTPPSTAPPSTASPMTTAPTTARPQTLSPTTKPTSRPTDSFSEVDLATEPIASIAAAPVEAITEACTGTEKINLLSRGDDKTQAECLKVCSQGACCFADIFNAIGISIIDETGDHVKIKSCLEGNEIACSDYSGCLNLSLSYSRPMTSSPTTTTPAPSVPFKFVAEAPLQEIKSACSGEENTNLITSGDEKAITECFNACRLGVCCYSSVFNAIGISALDEQGNKVPINSCFAGNEVICRDYSGCLTLTLAV